MMIIEVEADFVRYRNAKLQKMIKSAGNENLTAKTFYDILQHMRHSKEELMPFVTRYVNGLDLQSIEMAFDLSQRDFKTHNNDIVPYLREIDSGLWIAADAAETFIFT